MKIYMLMPLREIISVHSDYLKHHVRCTLQGKMQRILALEHVLNVFITVLGRVNMYRSIQHPVFVRINELRSLLIITLYVQ